MNLVWGIHSRYLDQSTHFLNISFVLCLDFSFASSRAFWYHSISNCTHLVAAISFVISKGNPYVSYSIKIWFHGSLFQVPAVLLSNSWRIHSHFCIVFSNWDISSIMVFFILGSSNSLNHLNATKNSSMNLSTSVRFNFLSRIKL